MAFLDRFKKKPEERGITEQEVYNQLILGTLNFTSYNSYQESLAMKLSSVYRAVNIISDSVAVLPIDNYIYKDNWKYKQYDDLYYLLNVQPNKVMSAYTFKKQMVTYVLLKGNAYIHITRGKGSKPVELNLLDPDYIQVILKNGQKFYVYDSNIEYTDDDIIHIMNYSTNGLIGISTLSYASMTLETAYASESHANNFFKKGGNLFGLLRPKDGVTITPTKARAAKESFMNGVTEDGIVVLDSGFEHQQISVNPKDSQLLESRLFNIITIAQFFGVSPHKLFDYSKGGYNSVEASQIDFLNTTLQPMLEKIENEFFRKLYTRVEYDMTELKFDISNLLRLDSQAQATFLSQMYQLGAFTTNEIREKLNANNPVKGGNRAFTMVNLQPLDNLISEQTVVSDNSKQIDNQLKQDKE